MYRVVALLLSVTAITCFTPWLLAQAPPVPQESPATFEDTFNLLPDLDVAPGGDLFESRVQFTGMYEVEQGTRQGKLSIQAVLQPGWHIYSTTQPSGGPLRTKIDVTTSPEFRLVGDFEADRDPHVISDPVFPGVEIEEFPREVTWSAPILLSEDIDPKSLQIQVVINGQVCETGGSCELITNERVEMKFAGYFRPPTATGSYQDENGHITIVGHVQPQVAAPGDTLQLVLTARLESPWHVYRQAPTDPKEIAKPTLIVLRKTAGWKYGVPEASVKPKEEATDLPDVPFLYYHEGTVSWTIPITVPKDADVGEYEIAGGIAYQTCTSQACDLPTAADFQARVAVGKGTVQGELPLTFTASTYDKLAKEAAAIAETKKPTPVTAGESKLDRMPLFMVLAIAFLAGLILNVMPCVLPVIGLKVMSFIHQAGGSRGEILALNIWFSLGLMTVFWVLAAAAAFAGHQWAEHFGDMRFLITMIGIVFAFGLSFSWCLGDTDPGLCRIEQHAGGSGKRRGRRGVQQRRPDDDPGHSLCRPDAGTGGGLGRQATYGINVYGVHDDRIGDGHSLSSGRRRAAFGEFSPEARGVDGYFQTGHGLRADGNGDLPVSFRAL